jgi:hypothetical protein
MRLSRCLVVICLTIQLMDKDSKEKEVPFKDFLDKTTNLVTLFGVFNALFIYSTTLDSEGAAEFLLPTFFILSIFVWLELILFTLSSNDGTWKYELFFFLLCSVEIGLGWYFVVKFAGLLILSVYFGIFILLVFLLTKVLTKIFLPTLSKLKDKKQKNSIFVLILIAIVLSGLILKLTTPALRPIIQMILPEKAQTKK